jgi:hypothetical protein
MVTENLIEGQKLTRKPVCSEIQERVEDRIFRGLWSPALKTGFFMLPGSKALSLTTEKNPKLQDQRNLECRIKNLKPRC